MTFSTPGHISSRQKIELGLLRKSGIKPSDWWSFLGCLEWVWIISCLWGNYWGKYGNFWIFAIIVNNSLITTLAILRFIHNVQVILTLKLEQKSWYPDATFFSNPSSNVFHRYFRFHATRLATNWTYKFSKIYDQLLILTTS